MSDGTPIVRYSRLPSQGIVYGIDGAGFVTVMVVVGIASIGLLRDGLLGLLLTVPVTGPLAFLAIVKRHGQALMVHVLREVIGMARKSMGATRFRARPEQRKKPGPTSLLAIPGRPGRLHLYEADSGAAVVWDAQAGTATVSCMIATAGMGAPQVDAPSTVDDDQRAWMTWEWAKVLGGFTQKPHVQRVSVLEHTRPGTVAAERRYFEDRVGARTSPALDAYRDALAQAEEVVSMHVTMLSITFSITGEAKQLSRGAGGGIPGMLAVAELEMSTVQEALVHASFTRVAWMTPREWGAWGKAVIDPGMQRAIDTRIGTDVEGVPAHAAFPMVVDDHRSYVETDTAWHRAYWIQEWPRYDTHPGFLSRLVFAKQASGASVRHTFALVASPVQVGDAMKRLDEEKRTWITNANLRARTGKPHSAADDADWAAIAQHEADLVAGQGELRFSAYLVVTATSKDALERESASMVNAASAAGLDVRLIPWQQWEAVATVAYPAGLGMK